MIRLRFHGRGGRFNGMGDVLKTVEVFASAVLLEGKIAQTNPRISSGRWGSPVIADMRADSNMIYERGAVENPDYIIVFDTALMRIAKPIQGLKSDGTLIINSGPVGKEIVKDAEFHIIAVDVISVVGKLDISSQLSSLQNLAMLGAIARITELASMPMLEKAIRNSDAWPGNLIDLALSGARDLYLQFDF